jgi:Transposase
VTCPTISVPSEGWWNPVSGEEANMKKSRFVDEQIMGFLKQIEGGVSVKALYRKHGFSDGTLSAWRDAYN